MRVLLRHRDRLACGGIKEEAADITRRNARSAEQDDGGACKMDAIARVRLRQEPADEIRLIGGHARCVEVIACAGTQIAADDGRDLVRVGVAER